MADDSFDAYTDAVRHWAGCPTCCARGLPGLCPVGRTLLKRFEHIQATGHTFPHRGRLLLVWTVAAIALGAAVGAVLSYVFQIWR